MAFSTITHEVDGHTAEPAGDVTGEPAGDTVAALLRAQARSPADHTLASSPSLPSAYR